MKKEGVTITMPMEEAERLMELEEDNKQLRIDINSITNGEAYRIEYCDIRYMSGYIQCIHIDKTVTQDSLVKSLIKINKDTARKYKELKEEHQMYKMPTWMRWLKAMTTNESHTLPK